MRRWVEASGQAHYTPQEARLQGFDSFVATDGSANLWRWFKPQGITLGLDQAKIKTQREGESFFVLASKYIHVLGSIGGYDQDYRFSLEPLNSKGTTFRDPQVCKFDPDTREWVPDPYLTEQFYKRLDERFPGELPHREIPPSTVEGRPRRKERQ